MPQNRELCGARTEDEHWDRERRCEHGAAHTASAHAQRERRADRAHEAQPTTVLSATEMSTLEATDAIGAPNASAASAPMIASAGGSTAATSVRERLGEQQPRERLTGERVLLGARLSCVVAEQNLEERAARPAVPRPALRPARPLRSCDYFRCDGGQELMLRRWRRTAAAGPARWGDGMRGACRGASTRRAASSAGVAG